MERCSRGREENISLDSAQCNSFVNTRRLIICEGPTGRRNRERWEGTGSWWNTYKIIYKRHKRDQRYICVIRNDEPSSSTTDTSIRKYSRRYTSDELRHEYAILCGRSIHYGSYGKGAFIMRYSPRWIWYLWGSHSKWVYPWRNRLRVFIVWFRKQANPLSTR